MERSRALRSQSDLPSSLGCKPARKGGGELNCAVLDTSAGRLAAVFPFATAVRRGLATALALAGVFAFAAVIAGLATALTLTIVLTFAAVFALIGVGEIVDGRAGCTRDARSIRPHCQRSCQESSDCCSGDDCFGWFHYGINLSVRGF
jgi:hypothetical protein